VNAPVLNRRRIERYAQLLDEASGARRHHARSLIDDELAEMLAVSQGVASVAAGLAPSETYRVEARALIMAAAERNGIGLLARPDAPEESVSRPAVGRASVGTVHESASRRLLPKQRGPKTRLTTNRGRARGAILVGLAVGTLALSGISAASGDAMPGDALYGMKLSAENAQIALAGSDANKGKLYLDFAQTRLSEAQQVGAGSGSLDSVLKKMDSQTTTGAKLLFTYALAHKDASVLNTVDQFVTSQSKQLTPWEQSLPLGQAAHNEALTSVSVLGTISQRSQEVRAAVSCTTTVKILTTDRFGPEPSCPASAAGAPANQPVHHPGGASTGTTGKPTERTPTATSTKAAVPATVSSDPTPTSTVTPDQAPAYDGGILGSVEHLLGGL